MEPKTTRPTVSWLILTHNRLDIVDKAMTHNWNNCGPVPPDELIWVDNGSHPQAVFDLASKTHQADKLIMHRENLGVAKGYNAALAAATCDYVVITGCDMLMPDKWLEIMLNYVEQIPGIACIYSKPLNACRERLRGTVTIKNDLPYIEAMPIERRIFRRELLADVGYFPETFGLYGYDDLAWAKRAEKVCAEKGLKCYVIPHIMAEHLGTEGIEKFDGRDSKEYHDFKRKEVDDPRKREELVRLRELGWPRFSPFY